MIFGSGIFLEYDLVTANISKRNFLIGLSNDKILIWTASDKGSGKGSLKVDSTFGPFLKFASFVSAA